MGGWGQAFITRCARIIYAFREAFSRPRRRKLDAAGNYREGFWRAKRAGMPSEARLRPASRRFTDIDALRKRRGGKGCPQEFLRGTSLGSYVRCARLTTRHARTLRTCLRSGVRYLPARIDRSNRRTSNSFVSYTQLSFFAETGLSQVSPTFSESQGSQQISRASGKEICLRPEHRDTLGHL